MILNDFKKEFEIFFLNIFGGGSPRGKFFSFDFSPFQAVLSRFWFFGGGGHQGANFFFNFLPFKAILSRFWFFSDFWKIDPIGGGRRRGGPKILICDRTKFWHGLLRNTKKKMKKEKLSFFHVSDDPEQLSKKFVLGGGHWGAKIFLFQFLAVSGHSELILMFPISCKIDPVGGRIEGDKKSLFAILPYFANCIFDLITHTRWLCRHD